jgi:hypothetical protein
MTTHDLINKCYPRQQIAVLLASPLPMFQTILSRSSRTFLTSRVSIAKITKPSYTFFSTTSKMGQDAPVTAYPATSIEPQNQEGGPGTDAATKQKAEWTRLEFWDENQKPYLKEYEGRGLLQGKAALITGGDSGIGRAVAILFAREGADVSIVYLPEEEEDAQFVKSKIEEAGKKANLMQFDLKKRENCVMLLCNYAFHLLRYLHSCHAGDV